jgi:tetratricopeptide (TPR) repeat protein
VVQLDGITHEFQAWNNCGPANLSMGLSFWDWGGTQYITEKYLKPNRRDKNVMPYEMADFVETQTDLSALVRVGGDAALLRRLLAGGYPILIEKGFEGPGFEGWMGHYELLTGYDAASGSFTGQNSYYGPDELLSQEELIDAWQHFNYIFVVIFPSAQESEVLGLLGPLAEEQRAIDIAAERASTEIFANTGRKKFFAWFNRGRSLEDLKDFAGAAAAFDEAFAIDAQLAQSQPEIRAWRIMWYDTSPYWAYYYTGRYYDVINLATNTLDVMSEPVLEESYYWRALSLEALGNVSGAIQDFRRALQVHPDWEPALGQLERLGAAP